MFLLSHVPPCKPYNYNHQAPLSVNFRHTKGLATLTPGIFPLQGLSLSLLCLLNYSPVFSLSFDAELKDSGFVCFLKLSGLNFVAAFPFLTIFQECHAFSSIVTDYIFCTAYRMVNCFTSHGHVTEMEWTQEASKDSNCLLPQLALRDSFRVTLRYHFALCVA